MEFSFESIEILFKFYLFELYLDFTWILSRKIGDR